MKQQENSPHPDDLRSGLSLVLLGNLLVVLASLLISLAVPTSVHQAGAVVAVAGALLLLIGRWTLTDQSQDYLASLVYLGMAWAVSLIFSAPDLAEWLVRYLPRQLSSAYVNWMSVIWTTALAVVPAALRLASLVLFLRATNDLLWSGRSGAEEETRKLTGRGRIAAAILCAGTAAGGLLEAAGAPAAASVTLELLSRILWLFYLYDSRRALASRGRSET